MFEDIFYSGNLNPDKLTAYGFAPQEQGWLYSTTILDGAFTLHVTVLRDGQVDTALTENETQEPYTLYKTDATGAFVGAVRDQVETVLRQIWAACFDVSVFKTAQALQIIDYVRAQYGDELEFLWKKFPDNAIWRRKDNGKWYGVILTVAKHKLGLPSDQVVEILDLRLEPAQMPETVDHERYFPGWHMNKKSWYTIILDHTVPTAEICARIDESYRLAKK